MLFNIKKDLKNKVFSVNIERVYKEDDAENIQEAKLEDDFGLVEIKAGGLFEGFVKKESDKYTVSLTDSGTDAKLKFCLPDNSVSITKDVVIPYSCNAAKEADLGDIPALKVAELKCDLFALVIQKNINSAVEEWKKQTTDFEDNNPTSFEVPLN